MAKVKRADDLLFIFAALVWGVWNDRDGQRSSDTEKVLSGGSDGSDGGVEGGVS